MRGGGARLAGDDAGAHSGTGYVGLLASGGDHAGKFPSHLTLQQEVDMLGWLANATAAHPERALWGHGFNGSSFEFGLAKYPLVAPSQRDGFFQGNTGYRIDQGVLEPHWQFDYAAHEGGCRNFSLGEPTANFTRSRWTLRREFSGGAVEVNLEKGTGSIMLH